MSNRIVKVEDFDGDVKVVDCDDVDTRLDTFAQLKATLQNNYGCSLTDEHIITDEEGNIFEDESMIDFTVERYFIKYIKYTIQIVNEGMTSELSVDVSCSIEEFYEQYERDEGKLLRVISLEGEKLDAEKKPQMQDYSGWKDGCIIMGALKVTVLDKMIDSELEISVYDFEVVHNLIQKYKEEAKRKFTDAAYMEFEGSTLDTETTLYENNIGNDATVLFTNPEYSITVQEKGDNSKEIQLTVDDSFTVNKVKQEYSRKAEEGLLAEDKLLFENQELDEDQLIYKYGITDKSRLYAEKEDMRALEFKYICAACGEDVKLKKDDAIICRECQYRCVYKARTTRACQYLAR